MQVSSELRLAAENDGTVSFRECALSVEGLYVEDEEFPPDTPVEYEWMLLPPSSRFSRLRLRLVAVVVAALLLAVSVYLLSNLSKTSAFLLPSPSSSSR